MIVQAILLLTNNSTDINSCMYVVAHLYNNGMASWCWKSVHASAETNVPVLLVCSHDVKLPGTPNVNILRFNEFRCRSRSKTIGNSL